MERTTVYFPEDLRNKVAALSRQSGRSQAQILREAVQAYVDREYRPTLKSLGLGDNPDVSATDTDEWLRENWRPD
jgi:hypothetical protein